MQVSRQISLRILSPHRPLRISLLFPCTALLLVACEGNQSALDAAGYEAARVLDLFWVMAIGGAVIWAGVMALALYAVRARHEDRTGILLIIGGGCVFPTVVLAGLLSWGLGLLPQLRGPADGPTISISGERFWWRIAYGAGGGPGVVRNLPRGGIPSANEIWLPLGRRTEILLSSPDVIHSFWAPSIAGKMDAIPGRVNRLVLEPTQTGVFNGACAEFCGTAHALMGFRVNVVPEEEFAAYLKAQAAPAAITQAPGLDLFMKNGCAACHTVRGTPADGDVGPDLTHVASRLTIAAGMLTTTEENIAAFISATEHIKPGVEMPSFGVLPDEEIALIAEWLGSLQ